MRSFRLILLFLRNSLQVEMEYRANLLASLATALFSGGLAILTLLSMFQRTTEIGGWDLPRMIALVGVSMIVMALWTLKPDTLDEKSTEKKRRGAFLATLITFFIAEIGDKTQIATVALAAAYSNLLAVIAGTTTGMMLANAPVIFCGKAFADRLPLKSLRYVASALFLVLGIYFAARTLAT